MEPLDINIEPTPNPNALKFVLSKTVKVKGKSTYRAPNQCEGNVLAENLYTIRGIDQIHFFDNVITITKFSYEPWENVEPEVIKQIEENFDKHDPNYHEYNPEEERREALSPELKEIEAILDKTVRPGLQADGGDIQTLSFEDHILLIQYQGACGTCPSATTGTLEAIKSILRDEYDPKIDVYIAPEY